jgi:hypothetical protein
VDGHWVGKGDTLENFVGILHNCLETANNDRQTKLICRKSPRFHLVIPRFGNRVP